jgi:hypothetical protein
MKNLIFEFRPKEGNNGKKQTQTLIKVYPKENGKTRIYLIGGCANFDLILDDEELKFFIDAMKGEK